MKISVITAVYNCKDTISIALESILSQNYSNVELLAIDGASTDGTVEQLGQYRAEIDVLVSESDNGIYHALNKGIGLATGDVIGFLHADDLFASPDVLKKVAAAFEDTAVDAVYGDLVYVSKSNPSQVIRYWQAGDFNKSKLKWGWMPPHPTLYVRRSMYERFGRFDTGFHIAADYDCMLRMLSGDTQCRYLPEVLVKMRVGGKSNRSLKNILIKMKEDARALKKNSVGGLGTLLGKNLSKLPQFFRRG